MAAPAAVRAAPPPPPPARELTLEQAVRQAFARNPQIEAARARLGEARGRLTGAATYPYNPVIEAGASSRTSPGESSLDFEIVIAQELEIAGQRGHRARTARAELAAERAGLARRERLVAARVHLAFVAALEARDLLEVTRKDMALAERLDELARRRLARGAATQLDVNVAASELGRAEARLQAAEAAYQSERASLAEAMGLAPSFLPLPRGELGAELSAVPPLGALLESARKNRADLQAFRDLEVASRSRHQLARSEAWPNVTLFAAGGREASSETLLGGGISIAIPLFERNQGGIEETRAAIDRARAERRSAELSVDREVVVARARYQAGEKTAARLRELVLGTLERNIELLQRSFEAGKATWPEVVVIRRSLIEAQRELTAAEAEARRAWIQLELAAGRMPVPTESRRQEEQR